jgi:hypothetical protein
MNDERLFERLASHDGPAAMDDAFEDRLYLVLRREMRGGRSLRLALLLAATLVLVLTITAAIAFGSGLLKPPWFDRSLIPPPMPTTAQLPCGESSATAPERASPPALTWSSERATEDWPGALRAEPDGCVPVVVDARRAEGHFTRLFSDPSGDVSPMPLAWVDIVGGEFRSSGCYASVCVFFDLAAAPPQPIPSPRDEWIAYGIVVDLTGDGRPDRRYGIDNASNGDGQSIVDDLRIWEADLATGTTDASRCCQTLSIDVFWPGTTAGSMDVPGARRTGNVFRFYVWASVIRDGEVVSTDYAPDFGWLEWSGNRLE